MKRFLPARVLAAGFAIGASVVAAFAEETAVFDLSIRGFTAGTLSFAGAIDDGRYKVSGRLESAGLVGMVRKVRYDGVAEGAVRNDRYIPAQYSESADTGKRQSTSVMSYRRGVPQLKVYDPPRAAGDGGVDPATQGGTVDPLTAMFAALRDVPAGDECNLRLRLFDGKRGSQVVLGAPVTTGGGVQCPGEYRRLEGFSAADMAEKTRFPFMMTLVPAENGMMRVSEVAMESLYGNARLKRR
jgi:hypothetical protein